jgi:hypothetical protein
MVPDAGQLGRDGGDHGEDAAVGDEAADADPLNDKKGLTSGPSTDSTSCQKNSSLFW